MLSRVVLALLASGLVLPASAEAARKALIIGNSDYTRAADLPNPRNDAADLAARLASLGFEIAGGGPALDLTREQMVTAVRNFAASLNDGDLALFFFAGHGAQMQGDNYLIPANDGGIEYAEDLSEYAYATSTLMQRLESRPGVTSIIILDACRNNPLGVRTRDMGGGANEGLAPMDEPRISETFIIFATAKGRTASDGEGRNSRFTTALLSALEQPERRLDDLVYAVSAAVRRDSGGAQVPWTTHSLLHAVYLVPVSEPSGPGATAEAPRVAAETPRVPAETPRPVDEVPRASSDPVNEPPRPSVDLEFNGDAASPAVPLVTNFLPDPFRQPVRAGGGIDAAAVDAECRGFISRRPSAIVDFTAGEYPLYVSASSAADTTLLVLDPMGGFSCSDDVDGLNPYLAIENPASGSYRIWVGSYVGAEGETVDAELRVSEHGLVVDGGALNPDVALTGGFMPDPVTLQVLAGGTVDAGMADAACNGYIARWPDFVVDYEAVNFDLHFSVSSEADTVLAVRDPSGAWSCNDDYRPDSVNPAVTFAEAASGQYRVWVGTFDSGGDAPAAELHLSERNEPQF